MAEVSQNTKYIKLDDGVSFSLVRTNPKLTTNTKLMYNGKRMYMESYTSSPLMNRSTYKNVPVRSNSTYNKDIASFLTGSGSQAYSVYQNFSDITISNSYDNQFETLYWCGAEYIDSSFYTEEIGFVAPLYLREKLPNYFLIFRLDTPSNYNFTDPDGDGNPVDSKFDFKTDILDKAVLIKTFDLREGSVLGKYIHNYVDQEAFEFDKSMYVNFSNGDVTYYGINKVDGVLEKKVDNFENELLKNDNPVLKDDKWFTDGFERNNLIFPYIMNIEYLFDDDTFKHDVGESYDFARYIGVYCNTIEFGEFADLDELGNSGNTEDNIIYYFEDNKKNLHRYSNNEYGFKIDGKDSNLFDENLISGFENERVTGYAEPLDIYEGFINRAQYGFEISKPLEPGDWIGIEYDGNVECYFADNSNNISEIQEYFRFYVDENSTLNDIAEALVKSVNHNKKSKFEARCSDNIVVFYAKREGKEYNGSDTGGAKMLMEASLLYNRKISLPISNNVKYYDGSGDIDDSDYRPIEDISSSDTVIPAVEIDEDGSEIKDENGNVIEDKSAFGNYYSDYFCGACNVDINPKNDTYKNVFKIYTEEFAYFELDRYLKTNNGSGRRICANMIYIDAEGKIDSDYRLVIVDDVPLDKKGDKGYDVSVSSTYQVEIMDKFKPNHGVLSWFPVKDFDFDINYSTYGQYVAFADECNRLSKKVTYGQLYNKDVVDGDSDGDSDVIITQTNDDATYRIKELAISPFFDDFGNSLETEYDYYFEQIHPELCLLSKTSPYILKWGYYDDQKDSCENPYRLNVSKVFGVSNLSANTYLRDCNVNEYTHSMPYYMTLYKSDYYKDYQYIASDEVYSIHNDKNKAENYELNVVGDNTFEIFSECVDYWVNMFKRTDDDMFSYFFSGKKYGKRFDKKYSRMLGGDKFHNPSTLFRGVKFEAVRQFNGVEKRSSEYNDYKFSFIYIPVMIDSMIFSSTVHFVKNDTFKFIVGIIFVNTMLGIYKHNIFNGDVDYFNKGFLYAACKDIIRPEAEKMYDYTLIVDYNDTDSDTDSDIDKGIVVIDGVYNNFWNKNYNINAESNIFYMWVSNDLINREYTSHSISNTYVTLGSDHLPIIDYNPYEDNDEYPFIIYNLFGSNNSYDSDGNFKDTNKEFFCKCILSDDKFTVKAGSGKSQMIGDIDIDIIFNISFDNETGILSLSSEPIENLNGWVSAETYKIECDCENIYLQCIITKTRETKNFSQYPDIVGEFDVKYSYDGSGIDISDDIETIETPEEMYTLYTQPTYNDEFKITMGQYYEDYDATIYKYESFKYYGSIECVMNVPNLEFNNIPLVDVCDIEWSYPEGNNFGGYEVNVSKLHFKSESLQTILINMGTDDSVDSIYFYNIDGPNGGNSVINTKSGKFENGIDGIEIKVDIKSGDVTIKADIDSEQKTLLTVNGDNSEVIENLRMDISIKDNFDSNFDSLGLKDYFSVFNQLSMYNITESINSDYNVKYYSTVEDNKYKIRVIEPDSIEIEDKYEAIPVKITQNNKSVVGSVEIKEKMDVDKIGIKVINRYSGFYNPIFNDILYYDDYVYTKPVGRLRNAVRFEMPYSNTNIDYTYSDGYGDFGIIKNMYYHKTNTTRSDKILTSERPVYPAINEYALDYRDYNIFSSSWDEGYFISQDDLENISVCEGIGSMKDGLCMFGSKYLNVPDNIFIDTFENGKLWNEKTVIDRDNTDIEIMYKEINNSTVRYHLFIEKRLKRYLKESLMEVFEKYINKKYSFGNKGTIEDDVDEYVEKNLLKLYKVDKVYMYIKEERKGINNKKIENEYLKYMDKNNDYKIDDGFPVISVDGEVMMKDSKFIMGKLNEFDRFVTYNLKPGFKESFGFGVSFKRK